MSTKTVQDFTILKKIGSGAFGTVFKIKRKTDGKFYAMKRVYLPKLKEKGKILQNSSKMLKSEK